MAFTLDGIVIDRIQLGIAENVAGTKLLYTLTQLQEATIETTAESKEATDKDGVLIKKFWQSKAATLSATNAMMDFNILGEQAGSGKQVATEAKPIVMPKVVIVAAGTSTLDISGYVAGTVCVNAIANNGTMGDVFTAATEADTTHYSISTSGEVSTMTMPTDNTLKYIVKYDREVTSGAMIDNRADQYPGTIKLTLKCLAIDECSPDVVRACYVVFPSFQIDPETSVQLTTDATFDFKGDAQVAYCDGNKQLYYICMAEEDEEE